MSDHITTDGGDLAYLKRLAQAGRGEPAPFLLLMAVFGGAYGLFFLMIGLAIHWLGADNFTSAASGLWPRALGALLLLSHTLFGFTLLWTAWRTFGPHRTRLSRAATAIWSAALIGFVATVAAFHLYTGGEPPTDQVYTAYMMPPVLLVLWGCAWWATAILGERRWLLIFAVASFVSAILMAVIGNAPPVLIATGACLLGLAFTPAVLLMCERKK
jgi:hypothetical protein